MADAKVLEFIRRAETDPELGEKVRAVKVEDTAQALAELLEIAAAAGYEVDSVALAVGLRECAAGELSDGDLDAVAGGGIQPCVGESAIKMRSSVFTNYFKAGGVNPCG